MFNLFDVVRLKKPLKKYGLTVENIGTIVDIQGDGNTLVVEFIDKNGNSIDEALFENFKPEDLELIGSGE